MPKFRPLLAVKEINEKGGVLGKKLEVIMYDRRTRNEDMVNAARRLTKQDKVTAVIGPSGSGLCIAAAPVFNDAKVPHIGMLPTNPSVTGRRKRKSKTLQLSAFASSTHTREQYFLCFATQDLKAKKAAVLYDVSSDYSQGLREYFYQRLQRIGRQDSCRDEGHRADM